MTTFIGEIMEQPAALRRLVEFYQDGSLDRLDTIPRPNGLLLSGMGASFHAAMTANLHLQFLGIRTMAVESIDLLQYGSSLLNGVLPLLYVSQSGSSGEVQPLLEEMTNSKVFIAVTNKSDSPLALSADYVLPLAVDDEQLVATKTFANSLAILWMLARCWDGRQVRADIEIILRLADAIEDLLDEAVKAASDWLEQLSQSSPLIFTGFGAHAATAKQAAQTIAEWAKIPALGMGGGALRHGFVEVIAPDTGVVLFMGMDRTRESTLRLGEDLQNMGGNVVYVQQGHYATRHTGLPPANESLDEFLSPTLDMIPVQIFTDALARYLGIPPGFRYLKKVVSGY